MENTENQRIKIIRKAFNLSQIEFSKEIGITQSALSHYESGANSISLSVLRNIRKVYNVNLNWLISGDGEMLSSNVSEIEQLLNKNIKDLDDIRKKNDEDYENSIANNRLERHFTNDYSEKNYIIETQKKLIDMLEYQLGDAKRQIASTTDVRNAG